MKMTKPATWNRLEGKDLKQHMPSPEKFGSYVRRHRAQKALTLRAFALATDLDVVRISQLERHATKKAPYKYEIKAIAAALKLSPAFLARLAEDFAPDLEAIKGDENPLDGAVFVCRTEE
jgi:transcriptional regulator with XRE-family HTH domain